MRTSVLIAGGGPVGMGLGLQLARLGLDSFIVERNPTTSTHPKSRACTTLTMENFRVWGIEDDVRAGDQGDGPDVVWFCTSITGRVIGTTQASPRNIHSPSWKSFVAQDVVERAIADALPRHPKATMQRRAELVRFEQDADGVTGWVRDLETDQEFEVRADYLVACDGAGSNVRRQLGIEMIGPPVLATMANYYYWADTSRVTQATLGNVLFSVFPEDPALPVGRIMPSGPDNERWIFIEPLPDGREPYTEEELVPITRAHWGIPDLDVKLINTLTWRMSAQVPETFRKERVLLAGDAAHRFPPAGGMGLNSGIQDVINLAWKLAMVISHGADDRLLDTYEAERRPIAESNNEWSIGNAARLRRVDELFRDQHPDPSALREMLLEMSNHINSEGQGFGRTYERGAFIDDGTPMPAHDPRVYWPSDRPGRRFPHMWLDPDHRRSTIDWFDDAFVLVCGPQADDWRAAGHAIAAESSLPLHVETLPTMAGLFSFAADGAVLVRPDGVVAFRPSGSEDATGQLRSALRTILGGCGDRSSGDGESAGK